MRFNGEIIETVEGFKSTVNDFYKYNVTPFAHGIYQIFRDRVGNIIAVKFLTVNYNENIGTAAAIASATQTSFTDESQFITVEIDSEAQKKLERYFFAFKNDGKFHANIEALKFGEENEIELGFVAYMNEDFLKNNKVLNLVDGHFRFALLSRNHVQPRTYSRSEMFAVMPNVVYTNKGNAFAIEDWNKIWYKLFTKGEFPICVDKFPPFFWANPIPEGVRVANTDMIRHGAHLAPGTTVMHYGFVNFDAGSLGKALIEGRVSAGTILDNGTDVGAGSGFLGSLSGGNDIPMSTGKNCLIGTMSECGIPLGDNVCVAAGTVFLPNTPVYVIVYKRNRRKQIMLDSQKKPIVDTKKSKIVKAIKLSGISNVTFRRNSLTGTIEVLPIPNGVPLNQFITDNQTKPWNSLFKWKSPVQMHGAFF